MTFEDIYRIEEEEKEKLETVPALPEVKTKKFYSEVLGMLIYMNTENKSIVTEDGTFYTEAELRFLSKKKKELNLSKEELLNIHNIKNVFKNDLLNSQIGIEEDVARK